jgi:glutaconate CoA-transferase, subunit B
MTAACTLGEVMIAALARTIEDGSLVFHGFASPLVQLAMHVAKRTHAPNMVLVAGATYGVNPRPPFLPPTSNDWVLDRQAECSLDIEELFDLAASGRMGRMFLSGVQIDRWGNANVTQLGDTTLKMKLPGGGGGCNLSCDTDRITLWTTSHRAGLGRDGRPQYRLVEACDFITSVGHRTADGRSRAALGYRGKGPQWLISELGMFDFDAEGRMRLRATYPDVSVDEIAGNTGFDLVVANDVTEISVPDRAAVELIRALDPLGVHAREVQPADRSRQFALAG